MKYLDYIFMGLGFLTALIAMIIAIMNNENFTWQLTTMCWVLVAFLNRITIRRIEKKYEDFFR